jgi:hypothetical protein
MTPEELLASRMKIATDLHTQIASLRTEVQGLREQMNSFAVQLSDTLNAIRLRQEDRAA